MVLWRHRAQPLTALRGEGCHLQLPSEEAEAQTTLGSRLVRDPTGTGLQVGLG